MTITITKNENFILRRNLFLSDGTTPLPLVGIVSATVDLIQAGKVVQSYTYPGNELRAGITLSQIELEVTTTVSALLIYGNAKLVWNIRRANPSFTFEGEQLDVLVEDKIIIVNDK